MTNKEYNPDSFRDSIATVDESGKRIWIYPKKPAGRFYNARKWVAYFLIGIFFVGPFIKINGDPLFMFNILQRKFYIFGNLFLPQDFHIFVLGMLLFMVFIVLFTVVYGRVWCGWACPQTVFMEMVFRRIEYWLEGDATKQRKLDKAPWNAEKIRIKLTKHFIFIVFSLLIANMVLGYIIGGEELLSMITESPLENWGVFVAHAAFAAVFYAVFARFREQACIAVCPYGRLQGVFLDKSSINIMYDVERGEPRGKLKRDKKKASSSSAKKQLHAKISQRPEKIANESVEDKPLIEGQADSSKMSFDQLINPSKEEKGDCIDCGLCVHVCPTGIDIRNGTQMECVNCTACIDACDEVMDKIDKPRGLIRYTSLNNIEKKEPFRFTMRMMAYSSVLVVLLSIIGFSMMKRSTVETTILRAPGMLYLKADNGDIRNLYTMQVVNKTNNEMPIYLELMTPKEGKINIAGGEMVLKGASHLDGAFFIDIDPDLLNGMRNEIKIRIYTENEETLEEIKTNFLGPAK